MTTRIEELQKHLELLDQRIAAACQDSDRDPESITKIIVTKTWPITDVESLYSLGVRNFGENRDQEGKEKAAGFSPDDLVWHFIGQLQRKKANSVASYADFVHSVDRPELVAALNRGAGRAGRRLGCFVQVSLAKAGDDAQGRGGADLALALDICGLLREAEHLDLVGLMAVAPLGELPAEAFARLVDLRSTIVEEFPEAAYLSAGMSADLEDAIAAGATHVRVGGAVLGERNYVR
ncbi:MAG: YggS family pyridoxal phosphate-dependent enzyme [Actinomycetia bacterium]|nr:YggS family pyridoxal phosphate-dependent enzyme [Actinomycetes bacterium]